jgi:hypothetical protein
LSREHHNLQYAFAAFMTRSLLKKSPPTTALAPLKLASRRDFASSVTGDRDVTNDLAASGSAVNT